MGENCGIRDGLEKWICIRYFVLKKLRFLICSLKNLLETSDIVFHWCFFWSQLYDWLYWTKKYAWFFGYVRVNDVLKYFAKLFLVCDFWSIYLLVILTEPMVYLAIVNKEIYHITRSVHIIQSCSIFVKALVVRIIGMLQL